MSDNNVNTRRLHVPSAHQHQPVITAYLLCLCCSFYFSSRYTERSEDTLPVRSKSNIQLNTSLFMYISCRLRVAYQRLTPNWSIIWSFRLTHRSCPWRAVLTDLAAESGSIWIEAVTGCVPSVTGWSVSNVATRIWIHNYKFSTANKTLLPLCILVWTDLIKFDVGDFYEHVSGKIKSY